MDKSTASSRSQKSSAGRQERVIPPTSRSEVMTPPSTQSMVAPNSGASQPPETSDGNLYLRILRDVDERIKPTGRLSKLFTQLAAQRREEEAPPSSLPLEVSTKPVEPVVTPAVQPLRQPTPEPMTPLAGDSTEQVEDKEQYPDKESGNERDNRVEKGDGEGGYENTQEPFAEQSEGKELEEVDVGEEDGSDFDVETLDERAKQRSLRTAKREEMVEVKGKLVELATKAVE